jgi:putative glycosyltransferase (TIGR04348 family)
MQHPSLCIVTPALADANNGNWQTARRWARLLARHYRVRLVKAWAPDDPGAAQDNLLLALHARRSAASIAAWSKTHPQRPLVVALTGTDLYRDIAHDEAAQRSLALAHRLIVLQDQGPLALPPHLREKCCVVLQSCSARQPLPKTTAHLRVVVVGHLREEKDPQTVFSAARLLQTDEDISIDHIGLALDPALGAAAQVTAAQCPHYRWLGGLPHAATRARIQRAHLLLHPSRMEGGAHVVMEAVRSGTSVLASHIPGNVGMLGVDYAGYFPSGDVPALLALLRECRHGLGSSSGLLTRLHAQCAERSPLFHPRAEQAALLRALDVSSPVFS